jgi:hypothetical protein
MALVTPVSAAERIIGTSHGMEPAQVNGYELRYSFGLWTSTVSGKTYTLSIAAHGKVMPAMMWLDEVKLRHPGGRGSGIESTVTIRAAQEIAPASSPVAVDPHSCRLKAEPSATVFAVVTYQDGKEPIVHEAWKLDVDHERFLPVRPEELACRVAEPPCVE